MRESIDFTLVVKKNAIFFRLFQIAILIKKSDVETTTFMLIKKGFYSKI